MNPPARRIVDMNSSLTLRSSVTRISRFGMAGLSIAIAGIILLGTSCPVYADTSGTYDTGVIVGAYENSGIQYGTLTGILPSGFSVTITGVTSLGFTFISDDPPPYDTVLYADDIATALIVTGFSGGTIINSGDAYLNFSWLPIDTSGDNDGDVGKWTGTFLISYDAILPDGVTHEIGTRDVTFEADVYDTPEPNSLYLLGSGLLGLAGIVRRKLCRS
jgi:hypothetical protein